MRSKASDEVPEGGLYFVRLANRVRHPGIEEENDRARCSWRVHKIEHIAEESDNSDEPLVHVEYG